GYHSARYYAPWLARWASCDPAGLADGLNVYAYSKCSPTVMVDPSGTACNSSTTTCMPETFNGSVSVQAKELTNSESGQIADETRDEAARLSLAFQEKK